MTRGLVTRQRVQQRSCHCVCQGAMELAGYRSNWLQSVRTKCATLTWCAQRMRTVTGGFISSALHECAAARNHTGSCTWSGQLQRHQVLVARLIFVVVCSCVRLV